MRKSIIFFFCLVLVFPFISAIEINMNSEISKGETIIASVSGNFFDPITEDNIYFYRGHVRTSFEYDVAKIGDSYYIYILTTNKAENNYSINISGVRYYVGSQISSEQISKAFKIINETADFSVNPGFVVTDGNFSIKVQNLKPSSITINLETEVNSGSSDGLFKFLFGGSDAYESITLQSGEIKNLYINLKDISETTIRTVRLSAERTIYDIPCYVIVEENFSTDPETNNTTDNQTNNTLDNETDPDTDTETNSTEGNCTFLQILFGTCNSTIIQNDTTNNETSNKTPVDYEVVNVGNKTVVIKDGKILNESATSKTCLQIKGEICSSSGKICQNATIYAKDGQCCISSCVKEEKKSNAKIIGWVIVGFVFIIILRFFVRKFSKTKRKDDPLLHPKR